MKQISYQQGAVILVLLLGFGLVLATGKPTGPTVGVSPAAIGAAIQLKEDHVDALSLAKQIIEGKKDFVIVDLRPAWQFDDYHIPGAVNVPLEQAVAGGGALSKSKEIILYSSGGTHAAQVWVLLKQQGYSVKTVLDGLQGWWRDVITPVSLSATDEAGGQQDYQALKSIREYFQGAPSGGKPNVPSSTSPSMPNTPPPAAPAGPKPKGGGC